MSLLVDSEVYTAWPGEAGEEGMECDGLGKLPGKLPGWNLAGVPLTGTPGGLTGLMGPVVLALPVLCREHKLNTTYM